MQRRPIDVVFSIGFFAAAALLVVVGLVMANNANSLDRGVSTQLRNLSVAFPARDQLSTDDAAVPCLVANASKMVTTPAEADCYANKFLGVHINARITQGVTTDADRDSLARANTLRSLLTTDIMMSDMGRSSRQIADVAYIAGAVFALAGLAGLARWSHEEEQNAVSSKHPSKLRRHAAAA